MWTAKPLNAIIRAYLKPYGNICMINLVIVQKQVPNLYGKIVTGKYIHYKHIIPSKTYK